MLRAPIDRRVGIPRYHLIDFGLDHPDPDGEKPEEEEFAGKVREGGFALQLHGLESLGHKVQAVHHAEHRKQMHRNNNGDNAKRPGTGSLAALHSRQPGHCGRHPDQQKQDINERGKKEELELARLHFHRRRNLSLESNGYRPEPAKERADK